LISLLDDWNAHIAGLDYSGTTARAVPFSALTTIVSFGTLALSSHRGMASLGIVLMVGLPWVVVCNLVVLPALLERFPPGIRQG